MGFGDALNWMTDKLKQSAPVMTRVGKVCRGSYDLSCAAVSKINNGAQKLKGYYPDSQSAFNAAAYIGDVVIPELLRGIPGGPIIRRFAQDGLRSLHGGMESGHGHLPNTIREMKNRIEKLEEDNKLRTQQKELPRERIKQSTSSSGTLHLGSNMEQKPEDVVKGSNMEQKPEDVVKGSNMEQKPEDVVKASLMKGSKAGVILVPLKVSKL